MVLGGTGLIGTEVARSIVANGFNVTVGGRHAVASEVKERSLQFARVDVLDRSTLSQLKDFDAVVVILPAGPKFEDCFRVEVGGMRNICDALLGSNVRRVVYLSGASNLRSDHPFLPARAKWEAEEILKSSGLSYTIWRAGWFNETLSRMVRFGFIGLPGNGKVAARWISAAEFGEKLASSITRLEAANQTLLAFGPEFVSLKDAARLYRNYCYPQRIITPSPLPLLIAVASFLRAHEAWFGAQMIRFLETEAEYGDDTATATLFGKFRTTVADWCQAVAAKMHLRHE